MSPRKHLGLLIVNEFAGGGWLKPRPGTKNQAEEVLKYLGTKCNFKFVTAHNQSTENMLKTVKQFAATNLDEYDSVWLILSSHGDWAKYSGFQADIIYGEDGTSCPIVDLTREFLGIQKPLVTVVQACRGPNLAATYEKSDDSSEVQVKLDATKHPNSDRSDSHLPDVSACFDNQISLWASTEENQAYRWPLLTSFKEVLEAEPDLDGKDIESLFGKVVSKVGEFESRVGRRVASIYESRLPRKLLLK